MTQQRLVAAQFATCRSTAVVAVHVCTAICAAVFAGVVTLDLESVVTGPEKVDYPIMDGLKCTGRLRFHLRVQERRSMSLCHQPLHVGLHPEDAARAPWDQPMTLRVWYTKEPESAVSAHLTGGGGIVALNNVLYCLLSCCRGCRHLVGYFACWCWC